MTPIEVNQLISDICSAGVRLKFASGKYGWIDYKIHPVGYTIVIDDEENLKIFIDSNGLKIAGYNSERGICNWAGSDEDFINLNQRLKELS
jgi:hypothetical protein